MTASHMGSQPCGVTSRALSPDRGPLDTSEQLPH